VEAGESPEVLCERILSESTRWACYQKVAAKNPLWCERVGKNPSSGERVDCYKRALLEFDARDVAICSQIADPANAQRCVGQVGGHTRDSAVCEKLTDDEARDDCWSGVAGSDDPVACLKVRNPERRYRCAAATWRYARDLKICDALPGDAQCRTAVTANAQP
jgi:hypothetical protein